MPLRGKILNVERKDDAALYKNNEISNLIVALGLGLKGEEMLNLRYGKVSTFQLLQIQAPTMVYHIGISEWDG